MSVWALGQLPAKQTTARADDSDLAKFVGKVLKWIPADLAVIYTASIKALVDGAEDSNNVYITAAAIIVAPATVWLVARTTKGGPTGVSLRLRMWLCAPAMAIWSLSVPNSGWDQINWVADNPVLVVVIAAAAGFFFSLIAEALEQGSSPPS